MIRITVTQSILTVLKLKTFGIEEVYDSELGFDNPDDCDSEYNFKLETWIKIMKSF